MLGNLGSDGLQELGRVKSIKLVTSPTFQIIIELV